MRIWFDFFGVGSADWKGLAEKDETGSIPMVWMEG